MKTLILLLLSITAYSQTYRPDLSKRIVEEINRSRANMGIWRTETIPYKQGESDAVAMKLYNEYKDQPIPESKFDYAPWHAKNANIGITSTIAVSRSENYLENNLAATVEVQRDFFNPLAYHVSVSVVEDAKTGFLYWVVVMYR